ncbi:hypothetical protein [Chryseobacterium sp.]|uniref:hypothetical protein n=1 Tax=Chryseobacterium sp. TaxID=1871047 RepID=UPI00262DDD4E|nr:hypothetical protein [Chryseobacterium sp.]
MGGAIGGAAISGALGTISSNPGAIKFVLPGIISGGLNSAFTGSNFLGRVIGGISYSGNLFTNNVTSTDGIWGIERDFLKLNGYDKLPGFFNSSLENIFNDYILKSIQFKGVYDKIKHLPVKLK